MRLTALRSRRPTISAALLAVSVAGVTALHGAPGSRADASPGSGRAMQFGLTTGSRAPAGVSLADQVSRYAGTGAGWVRTGFSWRAMEPTRGTYSWSRDTVVTDFSATGMKVLGVLAYSPRWAADPVCAATYGEKCPPLNPADFAHFAAAAAERYDGDGVDDAPGSPVVDAWEIWNEPNLATFWRPTPDPLAYTLLLRQAFAAIHAAAPSATVVSAGLSPAGGRFAPIRFLSSMYGDGAAGAFDALGFHPYSFPAMPTKIASWNAWQQMFHAFPNVGQPDSLRTLMTANGDGAKQIWATEFGAPTGGDTNGDGVVLCDGDGVKLLTEDNCVTEKRQASMVADALAQWTSYPWAGPLFWFSLQDMSSGSRDVQDTFGLVRTDGTPKPALSEFESAMSDVTAPSTPPHLTASATRSRVSLTWAASDDNVGVSSYRVSRGSKYLGAFSRTAMTDISVNRATTYTYTVVAVDAAGNVSPPATVSVRTHR